MLPPNCMILDRYRFDQLRKNIHNPAGYVCSTGFGGNRVLEWLDFAAIREMNGSFTVVKNRFTGKFEYSNEQQLLEDITPYIK